MIVPATIAPHLIPFLYEEFTTVESHVDGATVRTAVISAKSSLGFILLTQLEQQSPGLSPKTFTAYFSATPGESRNHLYGGIVLPKDAPLMLSVKGTKFINDFLEDLLRSALLYFVIGQLHVKEDHDQVHKAIDLFMKRYELYKNNFSIPALRQLYYRSPKRMQILKRFQIAPSPRRTVSSNHVTATYTKRV
jgi:hypothetical protein